MGACQTSCCGPDGHNIDTHQAMSDSTQVSFGEDNHLLMTCLLLETIQLSQSV